uniref:BHLH domain-containing protein n=1 Tax=Cannabis sativa TaxID=3483 RepID=A0A803R085_CANSA
MGFFGPFINVTYCSKNDEISKNCGLITLKRSERKRIKRRRRRRRMRLSEKFDRLQKLIPGGQGLESDQLMIQTTHYIMQLRSQLCVLESLLKLHDDTQ